MMTNKLRLHSGDYLIGIEVAIYSILAVLLSLTALLALGGAGKSLWDSLASWALPSGAFRILDQMLLVLMLVEILHTVRISIRSHTLTTEPFLIVGLIASIRRMLVITLEAADLTKPEKWRAGGSGIFWASMWELGLLGALILVLVVSITLLRRSNPTPELTATG
ncbi:MAG TPA: phosphate-starvation-inducible PsiE family protein [Bryobacteraceae bacterium]|jgi:uncharacterized membrane protein (DUF373 family)|nr:phosphate-starvation-inducible PsiE family protein [Bryobacteraceae bacterium]